MTMTVEELRALWQKMQAEKTEADRIAANFARTTAEIEIQLYEAEGRPNTLRACWLRAWLAHDFAECDRLSAIEYPQYAREEIAAKQAALERAERAAPQTEATP